MEVRVGGICPDCERKIFLERIKKESDAAGIRKALLNEITEKLDNGISMVDIAIEFENRLWQMDKDEADKESVEYLTLEKAVRAFRKSMAEDRYRKCGWKQKFSGEWVKEKE